MNVPTVQLGGDCRDWYSSETLNLAGQYVKRYG
jgi:hypothetical protein